MQTIIVIGGLSAGPSAAAKARRVNEHARIILFEKTSHISYATCGIPYSLSGAISDTDKLMVVKPQLLQERFGIEVHLEEPVIDIDPDQKQVITPKEVYKYDQLIYATGAKPFVPPIQNLDKAANWSNCRTIEDLEKMINDGILSERKNIAILGGGLIGIEAAENLREAGKNVALIELASSILSAWDFQFGRFAEEVLKDKRINVITGQSIKSIELANNEIISANVGKQKIEVDYLLMGIGGKPNTDLLLKHHAEHLPNGALIVNEKMETSIPDIYAAGDCASIKNLITGEPAFFPMGTHSNKGGRTAGANAAGGSEKFKGAYGTAIVKVFDYTLGRTGINRQMAEKNNISFNSSFFIGPASPGFYPGASDLFVELYFDPETEVILGAEIFGKKGVDKRIDVLSTAIYAQLKLSDLQNLDLAYAPPYSPAKDPVIMAGYIAKNANEHYREISPLDLAGQTNESWQIVDVRNEEEIMKNGRIPQAKHIPLDDLRKEIGSLQNKPVVFYCAKGLRGYLASMIAMHHGFKEIYNLSGGFTHWKMLNLNIENEDPVII